MLKKRVLAMVMATLVASSVLIGCGKSGSKSVSGSEGEKELTIWTKVKEAEMGVIDKAAQEWAKETGNVVKVVNDESGFQEFLQAANSSKAPDLYIGMPHDNLSSFQVAGLLDEVPSDFDRTVYSSDSLWAATSFDGKNYAVPFAQETVALFYNKDKVDKVPETMEELIEVAKAHGPNGFQLDLGNFYMTGGVIQTMGGYIFGGEQGSLNPNDIGLASEGAIKAYQFLQDLVQKEKLMPVDITGDITASNFKSGESIFYISGAWDIAQMEEAGINLGISKVPSIAGNEYKSFLGVQTGFVSSKSKNKEEAWDLMKYISKTTPEEYYKTGNRIPVNKVVLDSDLIKENKYFGGFIEQAGQAVPMPNILEMQAVWTATAGISRVIKGEDPEIVGAEIVDGVKKGIATQ